MAQIERWGSEPLKEWRFRIRATVFSTENALRESENDTRLGPRLRGRIQVQEMISGPAKAGPEIILWS